MTQTGNSRKSAPLHLVAQRLTKILATRLGGATNTILERLDRLSDEVNSVKQVLWTSGMFQPFGCSYSKSSQENQQLT